MRALRFMALLAVAGFAASRSEMPEDRDLTGCSVQLSGNIFNFGELIQGDEEGDTDYQVSYLRAGDYGQNETVYINFNLC